MELHNFKRRNKVKIPTNRTVLNPIQLPLKEVLSQLDLSKGYLTVSDTYKEKVYITDGNVEYGFHYSDLEHYD